MCVCFQQNLWDLIFIKIFTSLISYFIHLLKKYCEWNGFEFMIFCEHVPSLTTIFLYIFCISSTSYLFCKHFLESLWLNSVKIVRFCSKILFLKTILSRKLEIMLMKFFKVLFYFCIRPSFDISIDIILRCGITIIIMILLLIFLITIKVNFTWIIRNGSGLCNLTV